MLRRTTVAPSAGAEPSAPAVGGSLREAAIRSGAYLLGRETVGVGIRLLGLVLVMRQIGPADYGVYSAAAAYVLFPATLAQMGAEVFLIRQPGPLTRQRYDEVFTALLLTSTVVVAVGMGLSFVVAPWLRPYGVVVPMRVLLLSVPVNILWAPMQACIERQFAYRRMGILELGGDLALYGTAVPMAFLGAGPWSLIAGFFAWQTWLLVGSMAFSGLWPRLAWSRQTTRELVAHGRTYSLTTWIFGVRSAVLTLIVGTYAGAVGVGLVNFALRLVQTMNFTDRGVHRIGMVAISKANKDRSGRLSAALEEGTLLLMVVSALPFAAFGLAARWVIPDVFGHDWLPALPVYVLLALWATLRVPVTVQRTLLYAYGRNLPPAVTSAIELVIVSTVALVTVRDLGIVGFGIASVVAVSSTVYTHYCAHRLVAIRYRRLVLPLAALVPPVFVALAPMPWAFLLLLPPVAVFTLPSMRSELRHLASTARATMSRRRREAAPPALPVAAAIAAPTVPGPVMNPAVAVAVAVVGTGAPEMAMNGSARRAGTAPVVPPFQAWRLQAGAVVDPTDPRIATRGPEADRYGLRIAPASPPPVSEGPASFGPCAAGRPQAQGSGREVIEALLAGADPVTGLPSAPVLLARLGRRLGAVRDAGWTLAVVAVDLRRSHAARGSGTPSEDLVVRVADGLQAELRFDDLLARVGSSTFIAAVTLVGTGADGAQVAAHLERAARAALAAGGHQGASDGWNVRSAHEAVALPCDRDADELVRRVLGALDG